MYLASDTGRHRLRLSIIALRWVKSRPYCKLSPGTGCNPSPLSFSCCPQNRSRECVTNHNEVTPHRLAIVSKPEQEPSPVEYLFLSGAFILYFIHGNAIRLAVNHGMNVRLPISFSTSCVGLGRHPSGLGHGLPDTTPWLRPSCHKAIFVCLPL